MGPYYQFKMIQSHEALILILDHSQDEDVSERAELNWMAEGGGESAGYALLRIWADAGGNVDDVHAKPTK